MKWIILVIGFCIWMAGATMAAEETHGLVFLPSYFKCDYAADGTKSCLCVDTACNPTPCPADNPPPWRHRPQCPAGETCAPYQGPYACRLASHGQSADAPRRR